MASENSDEGNPFVDDAAAPAPQTPASNLNILPVGRNASLTLGTDALIILDESFIEREPSTCCGLLSSRAKTTRSVPYHNILHASLEDWELTIHYAHASSKTSVRPVSVHYPVDKTAHDHVSAWLDTLLARAYGASQRHKRIKVLINPFGGSGSAPKWFSRDIEPIFAAARCEVDIEKTQYVRHAVSIAENLDVDAWDVVACCSGDGVPHEVFNGLAKRPDAGRALRSVAVVQLPCGTGNAMSLNLNGTNSPSLAALAIVKGIRTPMDLVSITQGDRRTFSFLSQAVGIVAESDLGTENIRWMGSARFTVGFLVRLLGKTVYPCDLAVVLEEDNKEMIKRNYVRAVAAVGHGAGASTTNLHATHSNTKPSPSEDSTTTASEDTAKDDEASVGLPPLHYGTINDPLHPSFTPLTHNPTLGNLYVGNMNQMSSDAPFFPTALPNDGCLDMVMIGGDGSRWSSIKMLLAVEKGRLMEFPQVSYRKVKAYRVVPHERAGGKEELISVDGERAPFEPFQCEVQQGLGCVLSRTGRLYEEAKTQVPIR